MRALPALILTSLLLGQETSPVPKPAEASPAPRLKLRATFMTPQQMIRAMVALEQAQRNQAGAVVEVIGFDDETTLNLLSLKLSEQARLAFHPMDKQGHQELYAFMHQNPGRSGPVLLVPVMAGEPMARAEDKWMK